jgi:hypothetical protein
MVAPVNISNDPGHSDLVQRNQKVVLNKLDRLMENHTSRLKNLDPETRALQAKIKTSEQQHTEVMQRRLTMNSVGKTVNGRDINKVPSVLYEKLRKQSIASGNAKESIRDQMDKLRGSMEELAYSTL